ncbi:MULTISPECIES: antibiotic biosynthesis monooxygenase [Bacillaceae]|uniref:antibiotic biosynthesis monooxygenase family protein n=1 Tax=Bacillaceae TaxID=186817 RepID=UPI000E71E027|nr:antibiotic biosynthesis monooxygenase [Bacillus sp. PK3_68]RJS61680.1 antibiotic biosynthesis monooxygenase [Bacillus sp. PK3_68]
MYIFITTGTYNFMKKLQEKHASEKILLMENAEGATLLHETNNKTVFQSPRKYEVIDTSGELADHGFVVCNNIPVTDEGRPIFEYRFKGRARAIENTPGFIAIRVLRPLDSDTYVILTQWQDRESFTNWKDSKEFKQAHEMKKPEAGVNEQPHIFSSPSYITTYIVPNGND